MIAVVLVLINLTTVILLSSIEDGLQTWRLSQHDLQLARAWRAADSARFYALSQFQQGLPIPITVNLPSGWQVLLERRSVNCSEAPIDKVSARTSGGTTKTANNAVKNADEEPLEYQCWHMSIDVQQPSYQIRVVQNLWLIEDQYGVRAWLRGI
ncbi:hypothetical protein A28LD_1695 [Idiomarina sp. A28L]|uniref:hypothetical protein n=1 Tax=Idiomarina sp. A28L TaxID=1036674 RepID=UPI0002138D6A|nr:hypothetical protein [Idiomarina sp. A28L]EGN74679.1 hypothetical protein A28LD_1695 [Idiomarina sp. A28L]